MPDRRSSRRMAVFQFGFTGALALVLVAVGAALASRSAGRSEAVRDARERTVILARDVVAPALPSGLVAGDPTAIAAVDRIVRAHVLNPDIARVKIWKTDGTIVYADDSRLIGDRFDLGTDEVAALEAGNVQAEISDLSKPENRFERGGGRLLEVYLAITSPEGDPLLFEAYFRYDNVTASAQRIWERFVPTVFGGLLLLELVQIPLAWRLATGLLREQQARVLLLQQAIDSSDLERRRLAADLHDGVVQDLTGVAYTLAGVGEQLATTDQSKHAATILEAADGTRRSLAALRTLLVEIYPPNLHEAGIENALAGLLAPLANRGVTTSLAVSPELQLDRFVEALFFRAAQEAVRNVVRHSRASTVAVALQPVVGGAALTVTDNGVGFDRSANSEEGHVGLRLMTDLAASAGGRLTIEAQPSNGTVVRLEVPLT